VHTSFFGDEDVARLIQIEAFFQAFGLLRLRFGDIGTFDVTIANRPGMGDTAFVYTSPGGIATSLD